VSGPQATRLRRIARIDEAQCIGCTLCIQACPFDAIVGASGQMHTVLADLCTGCDLCVAPCPVDCIAMLPAGDSDAAPDRSLARAAKRRRKRTGDNAVGSQATSTTDTLGKRRTAIEAAIQRARTRRAAATRSGRS
jgi:electron transport complex protein RnfB